MKRFFLIALLGSGFTAAAQQPFKVDQKSFFKGFNTLDTTLEKLRDLNNLIQQKLLLPQATFSHKTARGNVYILPVDNMPCLIPDMKQVGPMPGISPVPDGRMPNALPKQRLIPENRNKK